MEPKLSTTSSDKRALSNIAYDILNNIPSDVQDTLATADVPPTISKVSMTSSDKRHVSSIAQDIVDRMPETVSPIF